MLRRRFLMAGGGGGSIPPWTRGSLTGGSPATILADGQFNAFPGVVWLDGSRVLVVFNRWASGVGDVYGIIGTVTGSWTFAWGAEFLIHHGAGDVLLDECASIVDGKVVVAARLYNGSVNYGSFLLVCNSRPANLTSSSTWATVAVPLSSFTGDNLITGRVHRLIDGSYLVGYYGSDVATNFESGVLLSASLTDWSARSKVVVAPVHANNYTEIDIEEMPDGTLVAHVRTEGPLQHFIATSTDHGATWTSPVTAFSAHGYPMFRRLATGLQLTVYRDAHSPYATMWRQSADDGATWSAEATLNGTLIGGHTSTSAYATLLQLDAFHALCVYAITDDRFIGYPANLYSQVFTDSSTR
jgi:hypothetical protein